LKGTLMTNMDGSTTSPDQIAEVTKELEARVKELDCLYGISNLVENDRLSFDELFQGIVNLIPAAFPYPDLACARLVVAGQEFRTANFRETRSNQRVNVRLSGHTHASLEVCRLEPQSDDRDEPFSAEARKLINAIAQRTGRIVERLHARKALRRTGEFLRQVTENIQEVFWLIEVGDAERVLYVSPAYESVWGRGKAELRDNPRSWLHSIHEDERESVRTAFEALLRGEGSFDVEYRVKQRDGTIRWLWDRGFLIDRPEGKRRVAGLALDITNRKLAEEALRESEMRFKTVVASLADGVMTFDVSGEVKLFNPSACRMFGYDAATIAGMSIRRLLANPDLSDRRSPEQENLPRPPETPLWMNNWVVGKTHETFGIRSDGSEFPLEFLITELNVVGLPHFLGAFRDITKRKTAQLWLQEREKELRQANHMKEQLLATAATAIFTVDPEGLVTSVNEEFMALTGYGREDVVGRSCNKFCRSGDTKKCWLWAQKTGGPIFRRHNTVRTKAGRVLTVLQNATPLCNEQGAMIGVIESFVDITEIIDARKGAEQASRLKSEFLANMSHEIRTPLNAVIGMTELAMDEPLTPKVREYLDTVRHSSRLLFQLISDVLDFSRIEAGKLEVESTSLDLEDLLRDLRSLFVNECGEREIDFHIFMSPDVPIYLVGDPLRLKQILVNLAGNAFKFTQKGEIVVRVMVMDSDNDSVTLIFSVSDTGIGIPARKLSSIFESFTQADSSTSRSHGGSGLGLAICGRLVSLMGGSIWVESEPGKGSTFSFSLPLARQPGKSEPMYVLTDPLAEKRVLVADDNETSMSITEQYLQGIGLKPSGFTSLGSALEEFQEAAKANPYELVILANELSAVDVEQARGLRTRTIVINRCGDQKTKAEERLGWPDATINRPMLRSELYRAVLTVFGGGDADATDSLTSPDRLGQHRKLFRGAKLLVVEDDVSNQHVAREVLLRMGLEVTVVNSGIAALEALERSSFDTVLMDIEMPEIDGYETTRRIRADPRFEDLPIVAMTAHAMKEDRLKCLAAGMNDYVSKPLSLEALISVLKVWTRTCALEYEESVAGDPVPPSESSVAMTEDLPGIDVPSALDRLLGDEQLFRGLLLEFDKDFQNAGDEILDALQRQDYAVARRMAHSIKGVAGNLSAMDLYEAASELEQAIQKHDDQNIPRLHDRFHRMLSIVLHSIGSLQQNGPDRKNHRDGAVDTANSQETAKVEPMLDELSRLMCEHDPEALDVATSLQRKLGRYASPAAMKRMRACLDRYDFEGAQRALESIATAVKSE
jgi:two-component system, sensor histidine kinase and response regulator